MSTAKEEITELVKKQPDDSSYDEIIRVLAFDLMVKRGLKDSDEGRTITNEEMHRRILAPLELVCDARLLLLPVFQSVNHSQNFRAFFLKDGEGGDDQRTGDDAGDIPQPGPAKVDRGVIDHRGDRQQQKD